MSTTSLFDSPSPLYYLLRLATLNRGPPKCTSELKKLRPPSHTNSHLRIWEPCAHTDHNIKPPEKRLLEHAIITFDTTPITPKRREANIAMTPPATLFHALLRPSVLQILRATGYHCTRPAVLDSLTDLAANYLLALCRAASQHTIDDVAPGLAEIRMALEDVGALAPEDDDVQTVQDFVDWFAGARNAEIRRIVADGDAEAPADWLTGML